MRGRDEDCFVFREPGITDSSGTPERIFMWFGVMNILNKRLLHYMTPLLWYIM